MLMWAIINGLCLGSIYVLVSLSLSLIYGVLEIPDFSQAGIYTLGAYLVFSGMTYIGLNFFISLFFSIIIVVIIGLMNERFIYRPIQRRTKEAVTMVTALGLLYILNNVVLLIWGHEHKTISISNLVGRNINFGNISFSYSRAAVIIISLALVLIMDFLLMKTKVGDSIRALIQNREGAILVGIEVGKVRSIAFGIGCILAAIAGSLIGSIFSINAYMGDYIIIKAFGAIILGGMGNVFGAAVGALIIGFVESFGATYFSPAYKDFFAFFIIIIVLLFRPQGIFGSKERIG